ncbi:phosphodiesterase [Pseudohalocynthiibacter aestuariivivens]|jgi:3',5'-cyclic-AMP phosphodiesterase|uniref:Phosphodiesterase n=1 Tax=Pseudohalocynthiibacter aestuariivivens TaxID=1591409 RepID=A0ABV5JA32_9RHOB|nr:MULTISPECIES: phosphodiesterase [Pseudohalocynthiibacter]MBS9716896.1 phosphodiesterase [Pseudohalocynthiibacter aestuariivivens]MCK0102011.1 phosphodiesterase [Pseudohalocynthiibacter sp. F2068]
MSEFTEKLLIFTDIHISDLGKTIIDLDPLERFQTGLSHAIQTHPDTTRIIITGDLAHNGEIAEYQRLSNALKNLPVPVTLMIGNHDNRDNFLSVFPETKCTESGHVQEMLELGDTCLITLDTVDAPPYPKGRHAGHLCGARLAWLETALTRANGRRVLIFTHHPPFRVGFPAMDEIRLRNDTALMALLQRFPNVRHLFAGHVHRTISGNIGGLGFTVFKSPCHQMPMDLTGRDGSLSTDEPGAYGIVLLSADNVVAHTEDFEQARGPHPQLQPADA